MDWLDCGLPLSTNPAYFIHGPPSSKRLDNVGIVVEDLDATSDFFLELGLNLEGRAIIEGEWAGRVTGVRDQRVEIDMMRTPDGTAASNAPVS